LHLQQVRTNMSPGLKRVDENDHSEQRQRRPHHKKLRPDAKSIKRR
jgi:hypothetical protein